MRIACVSPLMEAVPPKLYGGTERIVAYLCDELASLGHDVTLFASGDSATASARRYWLELSRDGCSQHEAAADNDTDQKNDRHGGLNRS